MSFPISKGAAGLRAELDELFKAQAKGSGCCFTGDPRGCDRREEEELQRGRRLWRSPGFGAAGPAPILSLPAACSGQGLSPLPRPGEEMKGPRARLRPQLGTPSPLSPAPLSEG